MTDHLVEIEKRDWLGLKELYKSHGEKGYIGYTTIDNYIRWLERDRTLEDVKFFSLNGDFSDGTFVAIDRAAAYVDTIDDIYEKVSRLVALLDFTKGYFFWSIRFEVQSAVENAIKKAGAELLMNDYTLLYYCPKEIALNYDVDPPKGIELRPITKYSDIEKANSVWPNTHRSPDSIQLLQRMAKYNVNIGAFKEDGTMVAWIFRFPTGLLCALQTDKDYFGHGYGTLVTKYISKKIAEMGHDVYTPIFEKNFPSRGLFGKLGFKSIGQVHWITTKFDMKSYD